MIRTITAACLVFAPLVAFSAIKSEEIPDLKPPKPEIPASAEEDKRMPWLLGGVGLAIVAAWLCWPKRKAVVASSPPFEIAQGELNALRSNSSLATPAAVSAIVRRYAVAAFDLPGSGVTAEEVASELVLRRSCPSELANAAWQFLAECDVAKFAPGAPGAASPELLGRAEKLIADLAAARATAARTL